MVRAGAGGAASRPRETADSGNGLAMTTSAAAGAWHRLAQGLEDLGQDPELLAQHIGLALQVRFSFARCGPRGFRRIGALLRLVPCRGGLSEPFGQTRGFLGRALPLLLVAFRVSFELRLRAG